MGIGRDGRKNNSPVIGVGTRHCRVLTPLPVRSGLTGRCLSGSQVEQRWMGRSRPALVMAIATLLGTGGLIAPTMAMPVRPITPANHPPSTQLAQALTEDQVAEKIREAVYLNQDGRTLLQRGEAQAALAAFQKARALFQQVNATAGQAESLNLMANVYHLALGQLPQALTYYQQALQLRRQAQDRAGEWATLDELGDLYADQGQNRQALTHYQQALAIVRQLKDRNSETYRLTRIASMHLRLGEPDLALASYQQALRNQEQERDYAGQGLTLTNMGVVYVNQGHYAQAIATYQKALAMFERLPTFFGGARSALLNNLAGAYFGIGDYKAALEQAEAALQIVSRFREQPQGFGFQELGLLLDQIGQYAPPLEFRQLATRRELGGAFGMQDNPAVVQIATLNNVGRIYLSQGQVEQATKLYQQALQLAEQEQHRSSQAVSLNSLGQAYSLGGQANLAIATYQQALTLYQQLGDRTGEGVVLSNLGQAYERQNQLDQALQFYRQALAIHRQVGDRPSEGITLSNIGRVLQRSGQSQAAAATLRESLTILEALRPGLKDSQKVAIFDTQAKTYALLQWVLSSQQQPEAALEVAERGRARAFVELLASRLTALPTTNAPTSSQPISLAAIRQVAKNAQAPLVQYSLIEEAQGQRLYIWVIQPDGAIAFRKTDLPTTVTPLSGSQQASRSFANEPWWTGGTALTQLIQRSRGVNDFAFNTAAANRLAGTSKPVDYPGLKQLYQLLIQPIADLLPTDPNQRVILIPHGALFLIPFPALIDGQGQYLLQTHTIQIAPSIEVLQLIQAQKAGRQVKQASGTALVVGNPTMPKVAVQPGAPAQPLSPLPYAEQEARQIAQLLQVQPLLGSAATKTQVVQRMTQAGLIHLATHSKADDQQGLQSWLALAPNSPTATPGDGLLTADEIFNLRLQAALVVLSACETGRGKLTGDGVIGLSRSFMAAGVPTVVVSLWPVPDDSTQWLMTRFYQNIHDGMGKAQALRQAMLQTLPKYPDPVAWGAFVLLGEGN